MKALVKAWDKTCDALKFRTLPNKLIHKPGDPTVETLKMPVWTQTQSYSCGFVATLMVLRYFHLDFKGAEEVFRDTKPDTEKGVKPGKVIKVLRDYGVQVSKREEMDFADIRDAIDAGRPILTAVNIDEDTAHWVVIYGYGTRKKQVFIAPYSKPFVKCAKALGWDLFRKDFWERPGFGLVCSVRRK